MKNPQPVLPYCQYPLLNNLDPELVDQKQYECNKCGAKQMTDKNYKKHLRIVHGEHPDDSVTCDKCGKSFTNLRRCRDHIKVA